MVVAPGMVAAMKALIAFLLLECSPKAKVTDAATAWAQAQPIPQLIHVTCVEPDPDLDRTVCTFWRQGEAFPPLDAWCNLDDCTGLRESRNPGYDLE